MAPQTNQPASAEQVTSKTNNPPTASTTREQASTASDSDDDLPSSSSGRFQDRESTDDTPCELGSPTRATPGKMLAQKAQRSNLPLQMGQCQHGSSGCPTCIRVTGHTRSTHRPGASCLRPPTDMEDSPGEEVAHRTQHRPRRGGGAAD